MAKTPSEIVNNICEELAKIAQVDTEKLYVVYPQDYLNVGIRKLEQNMEILLPKLKAKKNG